MNISGGRDGGVGIHDQVQQIGRRIQSGDHLRKKKPRLTMRIIYIIYRYIYIHIYIYIYLYIYIYINPSGSRDGGMGTHDQVQRIVRRIQSGNHAHSSRQIRRISECL